MSSVYKALPRLIPQLLLMARPGSEVILVSPWIDDVSLIIPLLKQGDGHYTPPDLRLSNFLLQLARDFKIHITIIVREQDRRCDGVISPLLKTFPKQLTIKTVPYLHAKAVVTESFVLETSANLIPTSLYRNVETCSVLDNPYGNPREWVKVRLGLII